MVPAVGRAALDAYLAELSARLHAAIDPVAVYLTGSTAIGAHVEGRSDVDVLCVAAHPLTEDDRRTVVAACAHEALHVPARKLELVVYGPAGTVELNLNTGATDGTTTPRVDGFWFVLDRALAREHAVALHGPPARDVLAPVPREEVLAALREQVAWYAANEPGEQTVYAAARAWRYAVTGEFTGKRDALAWAARRAG